jgi:hypothetical protein
MDAARSVLLESPAAKSILGGEVARQKHEFYMSQSRMVRTGASFSDLVCACVTLTAGYLRIQAAHLEAGHESHDDESDDTTHDVGKSVVSHAIIDKMAPELEAARFVSS